MRLPVQLGFEKRFFTAISSANQIGATRLDCGVAPNGQKLAVEVKAIHATIGGTIQQA